MIFRGKKGIIHGVIIWGSELILIGIAYYANAGWVWALPVACGIFFAWVWFFTFYKITAKELVIYYGPAVERIQYHEITRVSICRNFKSSAALSLDRLEIKHTGGLMPTSYIAPKDRDEFIAELKIKAPQAKYYLQKKTKKEKESK